MAKSSSFSAVVLAGGFGTRLKSISGDTPKPMVDVAGVPFLYRLLKRLEAQGAVRIVLALGYRADYFIERLAKDNPVDCELLYSVEDNPLGTGGAIKKAAEKISEDFFVVLNGDTFSDLDIPEFIVSSSSDRNASLYISGIEVSDVSRYGAMTVAADGRLQKLNEKQASGPAIINSGTYYVENRAIKSFPMSVFSFENDFVPSVIGSTYVYNYSGYFIDIGIPEDYLKACKYFE